MSQLISKIENSMPVMIIGFYADYLNAWVKSFHTPQNLRKETSRRSQIKILHTVKA